MKRLFFDIETSPNIGFFWQPSHKANIGYENIIKERAIICISYKWEGQKVKNISWNKQQNDKQLLKEFVNILNEADEVVAHNGDAFDIKWIRARAIRYGIEMPPTIISVDTLKIARRQFRFNSNRLDYLAKYLDVGGKINTGGFDLWKKIVLDKDQKALSKMIRYCNNDVIILERVFNKLKPYAKARLRINDDRTKCPDCNSDMHINKYVNLASGMKKVQLKCKECGIYHVVPASVLSK